MLHENVWNVHDHDPLYRATLTFGSLTRIFELFCPSGNERNWPPLTLMADGMGLKTMPKYKIDLLDGVVTEDDLDVTKDQSPMIIEKVLTKK